MPDKALLLAEPASFLHLIPEGISNSFEKLNENYLTY